MDEETRRYYADNADDMAARFEAIECPYLDDLARHFRAGCRVLDIGAGSGRDAAALLARGYDVRGVEPVSGLRARAEVDHPELAGRLHAGHLPDALPSVAELGGPFEGVLLSAILQHLPVAHIPAAASAVTALVAPRGRVLMIVPATRTGIDPDRLRDRGGRLFTGVTADELSAAFGAAGLDEIERTVRPDVKERPGHTWVRLCVERRAPR